MEMQESGKGHGLISKMIEYVKCESKKGADFETQLC